MSRFAYGPGVALALALAGAAHAQPGMTITNPDWIRQPEAKDLARHYPKIANRFEIEGRAMLSCKVDVKGRLNSCSTSDVSPSNLGFASAAIAVSDLFEMRPQTLNGLPVDGAEVRIPLRFTLPADPPPPTAPRPMSSAALVQAYRLVDAQKLAEGAIENTLNDARRLETSRDAGTPMSTRTAAGAALRSATEKHRAAFRDAYANAYAAVFSDAELEIMANFALTPASQAIETDNVLRALAPMVASRGLNVLRRQAASTYCAGQPCLTPKDAARVWRAVSMAPGELLDAPIWDQTPSRRDLDRNLPPIPALLGLAGAVRMTCYLTDEGELSGCKADEEFPAGIGFGDAAVKQSKEYQLNAVQLSQGFAGRRVTVRVGFRAPPPLETFIPPQPQSEEGLVLARELVTTFEDEANLQEIIEARLSQLNIGTATPQARAAQAAIAGGVERAKAEVYDQLATSIAAVIPKDQLKEILAFRRSPAGQAQTRRTKQLTEATMAALTHVFLQVSTDARAEFCRSQACEPEPPKASSSIRAH